MPAELILLLGLGVILLLPIFFEINVGIVAFVVAFAAGTQVLGLSAADVLDGFPAGMFVVLVGITLLLAIANQNGTVDWIVGRLVELARGRLALLPWVLFGTAMLTATLGPGAAPLLFVIGVGFIARYGLNPLLVASMIIHGTQAGAYSPIAPYGLVVGELAGLSGVSYSPGALYAGVVLFHATLAVLIFLVFGGRRLLGVRLEAEPRSAAAGPAQPAEQAPGVAVTSRAAPLTSAQAFTLLGFAALALGLLAFKLHIGLLALSISFLLLLGATKEDRQRAVNGVAWPIVLVICGVLTYVSLLQQAGTTEWLAAQGSALGSPLLVGLLLCLIVSVVTGVASTMGTIGILVPLSAPFVLAGDLAATPLLTAMAISAALSDISPFSTWGAMFLAAASQRLDREALFKAQLKFTLWLVALGPATAWLLFVVPSA